MTMSFRVVFFLKCLKCILVLLLKCTSAVLAVLEGANFNLQLGRLIASEGWRTYVVIKTVRVGGVVREREEVAINFNVS